MTQWYYERNRELMESPVNKKFDEILRMTKDEFRQWVIDLRLTVVRLWDEKGLPPRMGFDKHEIIKQFQDLENCIPKQYECLDEYTGEHNLFRSTVNTGNAVNQFFPTMMKVRINYTNNSDTGKSIYDYFAQPELLESFMLYASRHFKRDSFYHYSVSVHVQDEEYRGVLPVTDTAEKWIQLFETKFRAQTIWDYWLSPESMESDYTGFREDLRISKNLRLHRADIERLGDLIPSHCKNNIDWDKSECYGIRVYKKETRLFPLGLKCFRVSFCQYAVNFPPIVAKYIYERFTKDWQHEPNIYVWDPSAGWGGRLLGALAVDDSRHLVYLGNDPNTDHTTTPGRTKYHEIADFYREHVTKGGLWAAQHTDTYFWQKGSEVMQFDPMFQEFKGKLSVVFTSPPYFSKEAYSEDQDQSFKKFSQYDEWKVGFLHETLKTAVEWLRPGGYLIWNIADIELSDKILPLEKDSRAFLEQAGMKCVEVIKMALAQSPGSHRISSETGLPKAKNFCKTNNLWLKFEPLFVYKKPL